MSHYSPIDLHCHSTASDGELSPTDLLALAHERNIKTLALTDHDSIQGLASAQIAADTHGIRLLNGVEISVSWENQVIHILGLGFDKDNTCLQQGLAQQQQARRERGQRIGRKLEQYGVKDAYKATCAYAGSDLLSRTHFAHLLVARGYAPHTRQVFKHFLVRGKPGYVGNNWIDLNTALNWIRSASGFSIIAHPARYRLSRSKLRRLFAEFKDLGGTGLEVVSGSHQRDEILQMSHFSQHYGFYATAGSDYHGPKHTWLKLGAIPALPANCQPLYNHAGDLQIPAALR